MGVETPTPRAAGLAWLPSPLALLLAATVGLAGCEQLKAVGALVGLGGGDSAPAPAPSPAPRPGGPNAGGAKPGAAASPGAGAPARALAERVAAARMADPRVASSRTAAAGQDPAGPATAVAATLPAPAEVAPLVAATHLGEPYDPTGKRDPFRPYVTSAELAARKATANLTPLQRLELSQLKLVAIVWGLRQNHAMVEDSGGVGYVLRVGTKVGPNGGRVSRIAPDAVYVEEVFRDAGGSVMRNQITLRLPVPGGGKGS